jgi:hypothetical protein
MNTLIGPKERMKEDFLVKKGSKTKIMRDCSQEIKGERKTTKHRTRHDSG